jgi:hypothetical protein|tara:strand:+ start:206 stop:511 length:306 start_codon:yes stop_codon:yes gene_type:complete
MSNQKIIEDLILFYVKENYNKYLKDKNLEKIPNDEIKNAVEEIYTSRKDHLKDFLKLSLKQIMKENYCGDLVVINICTDIFNDDDLCINRITREIELFQNK